MQSIGCQLVDLCHKFYHLFNAQNNFRYSHRLNCMYSAIHKAQGFKASRPYFPFHTNMHVQSVKPKDAKSQCHQHHSRTLFTMHKESTGLHAPLLCVKAHGFLPYPNPIGCILHVISLGNNHGIQFRETRFYFAIFFGLFR